VRHFIGCLLFMLLSLVSGSVCSERERNQECSYLDWTAKVWRDPETLMWMLQVQRKGEVVYEKKGGAYRIGLMYPDYPDQGRPPGYKNDVIAMGKDITGYGIPDMVVSEWSEGAHCCLSFNIFELGEKIRLVDVIKAEDGDFSYFADLDHDGLPEFIGYDFAFAYWRTGFVQSPAPKIILHFRNGKYVIAGDLMKRSASSAEDIDKIIEQVRKDNSWAHSRPPEALWSFMLHLIYTGRADLVPNFCQGAWPKEVPGIDTFLEDFRAQLKESQYWSQIYEMNNRQVLEKWATDKKGERI